MPVPKTGGMDARGCVSSPALTPVTSRGHVILKEATLHQGCVKYLRCKPHPLGF